MLVDTVTRMAQGIIPVLVSAVCGPLHSKWQCMVVPGIALAMSIAELCSQQNKRLTIPVTEVTLLDR